MVSSTNDQQSNPYQVKVEKVDHIDNLHIGDEVTNIYQDSDSGQISYTIIQVNQGSPVETLRKIASVINVNVEEDVQVTLPFIPPKDFEKWKDEDKLFLYGVSGCGKSRTIYEIIKDKLTNFQNIYVINPRTNQGKQTANLSKLIRQVPEKSAILWDNFPDSLEGGDIVERGLKTLLTISSSQNTNNLLMTLQPILLEVYGKELRKVTRLHKQLITYGLDQVTDLVESFGKNILRFKKLYETLIERNISKIAETIWQNDPTPFSIRLFYEDVLNKFTIKTEVRYGEILALARDLKAPTEYYTNQFENIRNNRPSEADFLCALKLSYRFELARDANALKKLQREVFDTDSPNNPSYELSNWVYLSEANYSMHDAVRNAIEYTEDKIPTIIEYLTERLIKTSSVNKKTIYSFGQFLGENIQFVKEISYPFVAKNIYDLITDKATFEQSLIQGICKNFVHQDKVIQKRILETISGNAEFIDRFVMGRFAQDIDFSSIKNKEIQMKMLELAEKSHEFANDFGHNVGENFTSITDRDVLEKVITLAEKDKGFAHSLGDQIGIKFSQLDYILQQKILELAEKNEEIANGLGYRLGGGFLLNSQFSDIKNKEIQMKMLGLAEKNEKFAEEFGKNVGENFISIKDKEVAENIIKLVEKDRGFEKSFARGVSFRFPELDSNFQKKILELAEKDNELAQELVFLSGSQMGNFSLIWDKEMRKRILDLAGKNHEFAKNLGSAIGENIQSIRDGDILERIMELAKKDKRFANSLGYGLGLKFSSQETEIQEKILEMAEKNDDMALELGGWIGHDLPSMKNKGIQVKMLDLAKRNKMFGNRLVYSLGRGLSSLQDGEVKTMIWKIMENSNNFPDDDSLGDISVGRFLIDLKDEDREEIWKIAAKNQEFGAALGKSVCSKFSFRGKGKEIMQEVLEIAQKNKGFAAGLASGIGFIFLTAQDSEFKKEILEIAEKNQDILLGLSDNIGESFANEQENIQEKILDLAEKNKEFASGLPGYVGSNFSLIKDKEIQERILKLAEKDIDFAHALADTLGENFSSIRDKEIQERIWKLAEKDNKFAFRLGQSFGNSFFQYMVGDFQQRVQEVAKNNEGFGAGLAQGIGNKIVEESRTSIPKSMLAMAENNSNFAENLGYSIGQNFSSVTDKMQNTAWSLTDENKDLAHGFGYGLAYGFTSFSEEFRQVVLEKIKEDDDVAFGVGSGIRQMLQDSNENDSTKLTELLKNNSSFMEGFQSSQK